MFILWLIFFFLFVCGVIAILALLWRHNVIKEKLYAANREVVRSRARHLAAKVAAQKAEENCQRLLGQMQTSIATTGHALNIAQQIEVVSQQLSDLIGWITQPLETGPGRHALPVEDMPALTQMEYQGK